MGQQELEETGEIRAGMAESVAAARGKMACVGGALAAEGELLREASAAIEPFSKTGRDGVHDGRSLSSAG
jgi:hypothetical protein